MARIDEKVAALEAKLKQAKAELQKREARARGVEASKKRKAETSAKVLIGAAFLNGLKRAQPDQVEATLRGVYSHLSEKDRERLRASLVAAGVLPGADLGPTPSLQNQNGASAS